MTGKRIRAALSIMLISFDLEFLLRRKIELNSTSSRKTNKMQVTIHISRHVT